MLHYINGPRPVSIVRSMPRQIGYCVWHGRAGSIFETPSPAGRGACSPVRRQTVNVRGSWPVGADGSLMAKAKITTRWLP